MNDAERRSERRLQRERLARSEAERLLEAKAKELYAAKQALEESMSGLEEEVQRQTAELRAEIERRKDIEQQLIAARDEAIRLSHQRESFLARVSHEIRTPLNSIIGYTQLLQLSHLTAADQGKLASIELSGNILLRIINELLDVSKIDSGKMEVHAAPCDIAELIAQTVQLVQTHADAKGLQLSVACDPSVPHSIITDGNHLRHIVTNLVSNAVKYTQAGRIDIRINCARLTSSQTPGSDAQLTISVEDTGPGIPEDQRSALFDPYVRLDYATANVGSGLGLAISSRLADLLHGTLRLQSEVGEGSVFTLSVPVTIDENITESVSPPTTESAATDSGVDTYKNMATLYPLRILVADDNDVNQQVMQGMLEILGYEATMAPDGRRALAIAETGDFDVILMDVRMPGLNGTEVTRRLRNNPALTRQPQVIAVTASAIEGDRERFIASGMNDYMSKPIDLIILGQTMLKAYTALSQGLPAEDIIMTDPTTSQDHPPLIDLDDMRARLGATFEPLMQKVLPVFVNEVEDRLIRLRDANIARDVETVASVSHSLKGSSLSVGAVLLSQLCQTVQFAADQGELPSMAQIDEIERICRASVRELTVLFPPPEA